MVSRLNKYLDEQAPWSLYRNGETGRAQGVLYDVLEGVRLCALWLAPTMPVATARIWQQLGIDTPPVQASWQAESMWGRLQAGSSVQQPQPLFPRITEEALTLKTQKETEMEQSNLITIQDFQKLDIKIAEVKSAEPVPNTSKLLKLTVDIGGEERTLVAGIAETYTPQDVIGRQIVVLTNLQPATIRGVPSQGNVAGGGSGRQSHPADARQTCARWKPKCGGTLRLPLYSQVAAADVWAQPKRCWHGRGVRCWSMWRPVFRPPSRR
jgi:methionyl-tRNA synthetase